MRSSGKVCLTGSRDEAKIVGYRWVVYECVYHHCDVKATAEVWTLIEIVDAEEEDAVGEQRWSSKRPRQRGMDEMLGVI